MLKAVLSAIHSLIIIKIILQLSNDRFFDLNLAICICQTLITLIAMFSNPKLNTFISLILSLSLFSTYLSFESQWICLLFLGKIIVLNETLRQARRLLFGGIEHCWTCGIGNLVYSFLRFTLIQYFFLTIVIVIYKVVVNTFDQSVIQLPSNHLLLYQMIVTATTIGYGDVCPKSRIQMNFFIGAIPFICGSFIIYASHANPLWEQLLTYLNENKSKSKNNTNIQINCLSLTEQQNLNEFIKCLSQKKKQQQRLVQTYFNDWISLAIINYQNQIPLINTIIDDTFSKEIRLSIANKSKLEYFPKDWIIINQNDVNQKLFIILQGEVIFDDNIISKGFIFNQIGFFRKCSIGHKIITQSFVTVRTLLMQQIQDIIKSCPKLQQHLQQKISSFVI